MNRPLYQHRWRQDRRRTSFSKDGGGGVVWCRVARQGEGMTFRKMGKENSWINTE